MKEYLGLFLLSLPFIGITVFAIKDIGVWYTLFCWAVSIIILGLVTVAAWLI